MAITTYSELQAAIADWVARSDLSNIADFITLAETTFNYGDEDQGIDPLRTRDMETTGTVTVTSGSGSLPSDFLEPIRASTSTRLLTYVTPAWYSENYPSGQSTDPKFYTVIGSTLYSGTDVSLAYYEKIDPLATTDPNWLLTKSPNAYLFGSLFYLHLYTRDDAGAAQFRGMMLGAMGGLRRADKFSVAGSYERRAASVAF
jgi:hypothetical protein